MKYEEIRAKMHSGVKGSFRNLDTMKVLKTKKAYNGESIVKVSHHTVRTGVNYNNMASTKQGRADGTKPAENQGRPWGQWIEGEENYLATHKGNIYARFAISPNKTKTTYLLNGVPVAKEIAQSMCLASEFPKGTPTEVFEVNIENITNLD